jgi:hypothetical protein
MEPWMITLVLAGLAILIPIIVIVIRFALAGRGMRETIHNLPVYVRCA